ncbi:MAG: addiction module protein [Gemmatimonadota bacterium]|nr:addiction module protein [Gemmatimonadota bacterium]
MRDWGMSSDPLRKQILGLPADERFELLADVWDSITAEPEAVPVPDWHREELDRRLRERAPATRTRRRVRTAVGGPDLRDRGSTGCIPYRACRSPTGAHEAACSWTTPSVSTSSRRPISS